MALLITAAKDTGHAVEILSNKPKKTVKPLFAQVFEGIDDFLYDFKEEFSNYECYYKFDPYGETFLENSRVNEIKIFADSVLKWTAENGTEENELIVGYNLTLKKIKVFAEKLNEVCDFAIENGYGLAGIGD